MDLSFWEGKRVFLTGHTGFKGSWMCQVLSDANAEITGYSLEPPTNPSLFSICGVEKNVNSIIEDVRNIEKLKSAFKQFDPEIVIHMAAQPLVRESYQNPVHTYETNIMGTINILECTRFSKGVKSFLNVTSDKVYQNNEWYWGYRETDPLDGFDPYSNSKSCSELVTHSYIKSFFADSEVAISTARAGNVIGGGDFSNDRIIPDCVRAASNGETIIVRNPFSIRPYQHVLEPLFAYLTIAQKQYEDKMFSGCYNVGPDEYDCVSTGELADLFCGAWGKGQTWETKHQHGSHEADFLKLDCSKLKAIFGWKPRWNVSEAVKKTVEWTQAYLADKDICYIMDKQIAEFKEEWE